MGSDSPFFKVASLLTKTRVNVAKSLNQTPRIVSRMVLRGCHGHEEAIEQSSALEIALEKFHISALLTYYSLYYTMHLK